MWIALTHREETTKLYDMRSMYAEMEVVKESIVNTAQRLETVEEEA
jgi:hypothetical protein